MVLYDRRKFFTGFSMPRTMGGAGKRRIVGRMTGRKYDDKMNLDMPFAEALERFVGVDPKEMHANIAKAKKAKPPGGKKAPSASWSTDEGRRSYGEAREAAQRALRAVRAPMAAHMLKSAVS